MNRPLHQFKVVHPDPPPTSLLHVRKPVCAAPLVHRYDADPEQLGDLGRSQPEVLDIGRDSPPLELVPASRPVPFLLLRPVAFPLLA